MISFSLIVILAVAYVVLKTINMRARFAEEDAARERAEREAQEAMEEEAEEAEIRATAVDVDAETIDNEDLDAAEFTVEPPEEEEGVVIEVPEYDTVR